MRGSLSAADFERARSWAIEIVETLLSDARYRDEGNDRRFLAQGGLLINKKSGAWYSYSAGRGGYSVITLVVLLKQCSVDEATVWIKAFLAAPAHDGIGSCDGDPEDDEDTPASAAQAQEHLSSLIDVIGTASAAYLTSRRLDAPFPATGHIPYARCGEHGFAGILTSHERAVGLQALYITPDGLKSTVKPQRRRFMLEKAPDAVFAMPYSGTNGEVLVCEGLEDALSVFRYGKRRCRVIGLPGVGTLRHLRFPKGTKVTIVRDGDVPGSAGDKALHDGVDRLILDGVEVYVTPTPVGSDANDILQQAGVGKGTVAGTVWCQTDGLVAFLDSAEPAILSLHGEIEKLARLADLDYALIRKDEAKRLKIPLGVLDAEVRKARARFAGKAKSAKPNDAFGIKDTPIWPRPVDGAELLDALVESIGSYVVMGEAQCFATALWTVFTHCFAVAHKAPKLWIKSAERRSGKTRLLEVLEHLTARALGVNFISAAMLPRVITQYSPTLLMDEIDTFIEGNEAMRGVLNTGFDRDKFIIIGIRVGDDWVPGPFNAWCPQALAGIGNLPDTITDRAFAIELERKPRDTTVKRLRRRDTGPLEELAQQCARWAADNLHELEDAVPDMPRALNDRAADAWELCIAIADRASEAWGRQARRAALTISGDGVDSGSIGEQLLSDIRSIFDAMRGVDKRRQRIAGQDLVFRLNEMVDRPWPEFRKGLPLSQATLAHLLKAYHISPCQLKIGGRKTRGYTRNSFERAFELYLPPLGGVAQGGPSENFLKVPLIPPLQPGTSVPPEEFCGVQADVEVVPDSERYHFDNAENPSETAIGTEVPPIYRVKEGTSKEILDNDGFPPNLPPPNGLDNSPLPPYRKPLSEVEEQILRLRCEHPDWSFRKLGRECAVTHKRVQRVIAAAQAAEKGSR